jgi:hypothetical protein
MSDPPPANAGNIFAQWQDGTLTDIAALRSLWSDLREVESDLAPFSRPTGKQSHPVRC